MCRHVKRSPVTCYKYSITCQDDLLTVDNAQSDVTAFLPISEAARSWSDDKSIWLLLYCTVVHMRSDWDQWCWIGYCTALIFLYDVTLYWLSRYMSVCSLLVRYWLEFESALMRIIIMRSVDVLTYNKSFVFSCSDRLEENIQKCITIYSVWY